MPEGAASGQAGPGTIAQSLLLGQGPTLDLRLRRGGPHPLRRAPTQSPLGLNLQTLAGFGGVLGMMDQAHERRANPRRLKPQAERAR